MTSSTLPAAGRTGPGLPGRDVGAVVIGGDYQGLGIARSLGRRGIPVCVIDDEISIARASRFVRDTVRVRLFAHQDPRRADRVGNLLGRAGMTRLSGESGSISACLARPVGIMARPALLTERACFVPPTQGAHPT